MTTARFGDVGSFISGTISSVGDDVIEITVDKAAGVASKDGSVKPGDVVTVRRQPTPPGVWVWKLNSRVRTHRVVCIACGRKWDGNREDGLKLWGRHECPGE